MAERVGQRYAVPEFLAKTEWLHSHLEDYDCRGPHLRAHRRDARILEYRGITPDREVVAHWQAGIRAGHGAPWFSSFSGMRGSTKPRRLME